MNCGSIIFFEMLMNYETTIFFYYESDDWVKSILLRKYIMDKFSGIRDFSYWLKWDLEIYFVFDN